MPTSSDIAVGIYFHIERFGLARDIFIKNHSQLRNPCCDGIRYCRNPSSGIAPSNSIHKVVPDPDKSAFWKTVEPDAHNGRQFNPADFAIGIDDRRGEGAANIFQEHKIVTESLCAGPRLNDGSLGERTRIAEWKCRYGDVKMLSRTIQNET